MKYFLKSRVILFLMAAIMLIGALVFGLSNSLSHSHASAGVVKQEPTWALPFAAGTSVSIGPLGLHDHNFGSMLDDQTKKVFTFKNKLAPDSLDLVLQPPALGTSTIPTTSLANGKVLAVWSACQLVLIDHGNGWWAIYLHMANIAVTSGETVTTNSIIGYPTTHKPTLKACGSVESTAEHVHFAFLQGSGTVGSYVPMLGKTLCGAQVVESDNNPTNILLKGLTTSKAQTFTVPNCTSSGATWKIVPSQNIGTNTQYFTGVATLSDHDIWAVGTYANTTDFQTLTEHWNGTNWSVISSPNIGSGPSLNAVAAVSTNDVWAVGNYDTNTNISQPIIEHWNGTNWTIIASPILTNGGILTSVATISSTNVWAVGYTNTGQGLIEHWDGTSWSIISSPTITNGGLLNGVVAISANDIWAVGYISGIPFVSSSTTLTEHWNGTSWSIISSPNVGSNGNELTGITAISTNDIWTVGYSYDTNFNRRTLTEHWNGTSWNIISSPNGTGTETILNAVIAVSTSDIWAVGEIGNGSSSKTFTMHWNGTNWSIISSPNSVGTLNNLSAVAAVSSNMIWAVGSGQNSNNTTQTLTELYS